MDGINLFLHLLELRGELLNRLVIFSECLHRDLIKLLYLRSLHFSHFVLASNLRISKSFFLS